MSRDDRPTVYSTEDGDLRQQVRHKPKGSLKKSVPPGQQTVYLHRETKGRGGKVVSLVKNLQLNPKDMKALGKILKRACGTGGTVKGDVIEIQGEHREKIATKLRGLGYRVKISGG